MIGILFAGFVSFLFGILLWVCIRGIEKKKALIVPGSEWVKQSVGDNPFMGYNIYTVKEVSKSHLLYEDYNCVYTADKTSFIQRFKPKPKR